MQQPLPDAKRAEDFLTSRSPQAVRCLYVETGQYCIGGQGRYKVELDGVALGQEMDFGHNNRQKQGAIRLSEGNHTLTYRADGTASDIAGHRVPGIQARIYSIDFTADFTAAN